MTPTFADDIDQHTKLPIRAWRVHEKIDKPGMVSSIEQFLDAADSEIIAGGENMKGDHGVALLREADLFMWGPAARPSLMTEEGRRVFVNVIVYMAQFGAARQQVWRGVPARSGVSDALRQKVGFVRVPHGSSVFAVDEEAESIGVPNNEVGFIETCVGLLRVPSEAAKARRLLERYTGLSLVDARAWEQWLQENRSALYFSDADDYRFYTGPSGPRPPATLVPAVLRGITMEEATDIDPVSVGAGAAGYYTHGLTKGAYTKLGGVSTLVVRLRIADGWHTYARVPPGVPYVETRLTVDLPKGFRWAGDWEAPEGRQGGTPGLTEYSGEVVFVRRFYATTPAKVTLAGTVGYHACDAEKCLPLASKPFSVLVEVAAR